MGSFIASLFTTALAVQGAIAALTTTTATLGTQHCHSPDQFGNYADVNDRVQKFGASMTCHKKGGLISSGDSPITFYVTGANDKPGYHYGISWVDGCEGDSQNSLTPVEGTTCEDILIGNWKNCNNNGAGGWIDAGCVRYKFWPSA
ncbi:hypothetical protein BDV59DRAFT_187894 [Aspergillus ambiguus]|uniref:uncharacterized protein n=1 Tax=Aspergillus ambiguus TaxID=176160 RepID=UPI003CCD6569